MTPPTALTIAGSDSGGGAGIAADLKTFEAHGVWGLCAVTAVTAQDTLGVHDLVVVPAPLVRLQIERVAADLGVAAAKTGMLASAEVAASVADAVQEAGIDRLVVDPVLASGHGDRLLADDAVAVVRDRLLPLATVVTPNLAEAARLVGADVDDREAMVEAAAALVALGARVALVTGGHLEGPGSPDCMVVAGADPVWLEGSRQPAAHTHGGGCVLSAAVTAELARGMDPADACVAAKRFVERAMAAGLPLGRGVGPVNPAWERALGYVSGTPW